MGRKFRGFWVDASIIQKGLPIAERDLLCFLKGFGEKGCFMTDKTIGETLCMTANSVSCIMKKLRKRGLITTTMDGRKRTIFVLEACPTDNCPTDNVCPTDKSALSVRQGTLSVGQVALREKTGVVYQMYNKVCSSRTTDDTTQEKKILPAFSKNEPSKIPPSSDSIEKYCLKKIRAFQRLNGANPRASKNIYAQLVETFEDREQDPNEKIPLLLDYLVSKDDKSLTDMASLVFGKIRVQKNEKYDFFLSDHIDEILTAINESC